MTLNVKYWAKGASVPSTWTAVNVLTCYVRIVRSVYDSGEAIDGTNETWRRKRYKVTIEAGPLAMNTSADRAILEAMQDAYYIRINDSRYSYLGSSNTINFVWDGDSEPSREEPSNSTESVVFELKSEAVV